MTSTIRLGDGGAAVASLHQHLLEAGLLPPEAGEEARAGHFGAATLGAVKTFQVKHALAPDGIVGARTWAALLGISEAAAAMPEPDYAAMSPLMNAAVRLASIELHKGVVEIPPGSNRGPEVEQYQLGRWRDGSYLVGLAWCARFVLWCVEGAAMAFGVKAPTAGGGDLAGATKWLAWAKATGRLIAAPRPGCVALVRVEGHGHVWLVTRVEGDRHATIEGNSGNRVAGRWRPNAGVEGQHFISLD